MGEGQKTEMLDVSKLTGDGVDVTFVVAVPGQVEKRYPMRAASMRVGRSDQSDIAIKDASVSSRHCDLVKEGGRLLVRDLGSSNGTFLNGQRTQEGELFEGDVVRLGNAATVTVSMANAGGGRSAPMPPADGAGSTAMISADQLEAMRRPAPAASRRPPAVPPPRSMPAPSRGPSNGLIVGVAIGVAVVILVGVIGGFMLMRSRAHAADAEAVSQIAIQVKALTQSSPCATVQDAVGSLSQIGAGIPSPTFPVHSRSRPVYEKFIEAQREKVRQYKRIADLVESSYETAAQTQVNAVKQLISKLNDETLKSKAKDLSQALDDRLALAQDYDGGWKKLAGETDHYADVAEQVFIKGTGNAAEYTNYHFSRVPPVLHRSCRQNHETSGKDIDEKVAALQALVAK